MTDGPSPLVTAAEMREIDRIAIEDAGIPGVVLMESAGRAVAEAARGLYHEVGGGMVCVLCGSGNNGGDGFVAARYLHQWDIPVTCVLASSRGKVSGDALANLDIVDTLGIEVVEATGGIDEHVELALEAGVVFIDALLGTGLASDVRGTIAELIGRVNDEGVPVVAVDLPSGIHADTGEVLGVAIMADTTVTMALPKRGLVLHPGCDYAGDLIVADIGIPGAAIEHVSPKAMLSDDLDWPYLPPRHANSHKGHFGHVLVVGGAPGKGGAALLSAMGALRSGAGLVSVLTDARCQAALEGRYPELMVDAAWTPNGLDEDRLSEAQDGKHAVVVGPGLTPDAVGRRIVQALLAGDAPVVMDAGALTVMAERPELWREAVAPRLITPHPGEASRLLGISIQEVQHDRFAAVAGLVELTGAIVILKGAGTLIGMPDGRVALNQTGGPGLSSAGTGDVLAGVLGAFLCRGLDPFEAARSAVYVHGLAGDRLSRELGPDGLVATDLFHAIPAVLRPPID